MPSSSSARPSCMTTSVTDQSFILPNSGYPPYYTRTRPTTLDCASLFSRCDRRWLAEYCHAFAEKTGRISRNVRGKLASWRLSMPHNCPNCPGGQRAAQMMHSFSDASFLSRPGRQYVDPMMSSNSSMMNHHRRPQGMMHSYGMNYEHGERYEELASRGPTTSAYSRDIIRSLEELELNRIDRHHQPQSIHQSYQHLNRERQYPYDAYLSSSWSSERPYATLPKRSRTISLEEQFLPRDLQRLSRYPKSLQDLKYLEIEAILGRDPRSVSYPSSGENRFARREDLSQLDDRPLRSSSRSSSRMRDDRRWMRMDEEAQDRLFLEGLAGGSQIERYEPGKVHYEREYRIYGKDTVALIFYKTCYL